MAFTFPRSLPLSVDAQRVVLRATTASTSSQSPFTFASQSFDWGGEMWGLEFSLPPMDRDEAEPWISWLLSMRGHTGSFLMGDPSSPAPRGTVTAGTLTGSQDDEQATVTITGNIKVGDYFQIGNGATSKLHKCLDDRTGNGIIEIFPKLRANYTDEPMTFVNPRGVFKLTSNVVEWDVNSAVHYGLNFSARESIT